MKQAAAIKRASKQARNAMYDLDARVAADLLDLYRQAADEVRAKLAAAVDASDTVPTHRLQALLQQIESVIDGLADKRNQAIDTAIGEAATLGVRPFTALGALAVGGSEAVLSTGAASLVHENAVRFVREFVQPDELTLSDRLWRMDRGAKEALSRAVGMAVIQGQSAAAAAQQLVMTGEAIPADLAQRVAASRLPALRSAADLLTKPGGRDGYWQAERVMRTEINRAHGEAFMAAGAGTPGFGGWRYLLSPRHPAPDICDLLSTQNLHGLGRGVYPTRAATPWPAHPNTLSFIEMVFADEITDADRAGKETALQALGRLAPDVRAGALGQTKAEYFDKGLLSTGMIRSPLYAVEQRLERQANSQASQSKTSSKPAKPPMPPVWTAPVTLDDYIKAGRTITDKLTVVNSAESAAKHHTELLDLLNKEVGISTASKVASTGGGAKLVREASQHFPDSWTKKADELGPLFTRASAQARGFHYTEMVNSAVRLPGFGTVRNVRPGTGWIEIGSGRLGVAIHEYAHRLQTALPDLDELFQTLHRRRTVGAPLERLKDLYPNSSYAASEVTRKDGYRNAYQGREYAHAPSNPALEVMTMAFEDVLGLAEKTPARLAAFESVYKNDREMFDFVVGLLRWWKP